MIPSVSRAGFMGGTFFLPNPKDGSLYKWRQSEGRFQALLTSEVEVVASSAQLVELRFENACVVTAPTIEELYAQLGPAATEGCTPDQQGVLRLVRPDAPWPPSCATPDRVGLVDGNGRRCCYSLTPRDCETGERLGGPGDALHLG